VVAAILFIDAAMLLSFSLASYYLPEQTFLHIQGFFRSIPYFRNLPLDNDPWTVFVDVILGLWAALKGFGIWWMWSWVRALIIIDLLCRVGDFMFFASVSGQQGLKGVWSNPDFVLGSLINIAVLLYLLDPGVKEAFARRE